MAWSFHRIGSAVSYSPIQRPQRTAADGGAKPVDFGIALEIGKGEHPLIGDNRQLGTPDFGAPEQFFETGAAETFVNGKPSTEYVAAKGVFTITLNQ